MSVDRHLVLVPPIPQTDHIPDRSRVVYLLTEDMARAHMAQYLVDDHQRLARRLARAHRLQRRADRAAARAQRANVLALR